MILLIEFNNLNIKLELLTITCTTDNIMYMCLVEDDE